MAIRALLNSWFPKPGAKSELVIHDFTYVFKGHEITMVKQMDEGLRVFIVGVGGKNVKKDDLVKVLATKGPRPPVLTYRVEEIATRGDEWRAYASLVQLKKKARLGNTRVSVISHSR